MPTKDAEGNNVFTQEELDEVVKERLKRAKTVPDDYEDLKAKAKELEELKASEMSEAEKAKADAEKQKKRADDLAAQIKAAEKKSEHDALVASVAKEKGVPADFLNGDTKEELEAFADQLSKWGNPAAPVLGGEGTTANAAPKEDAAFAKKLFSD